MSSHFSTALRDEIASIEKALESDPRYIKLRELRRVLSLYDEPNDFTTGTTVVVVGAPEPRIASGRRPSPERERVIDIAKMFLANRGTAPTPTRLVLDHLEQEGIHVGGEVPLNNLSAMLSNSSEFLSHGRAGWTLMSKTFQILIEDLCRMLTHNELLEAASLWVTSSRLPPHIAHVIKEMLTQRIGRQPEDYQFRKLANMLMETVNFATARDLNLSSYSRT